MKRRDLISLVAVVGIAWALPSVSSAEESVADLAAKASDQLRVLAAFQTMERAINDVNHFVLYGTISETGGWNANEYEEDAERYSNAFIVRNRIEDLLPGLARARATVERSKNVSDAEKAAAGDIEDAAKTLFGVADEIADALAAKDVDRARVVYREKGRPAFLEGQRISQSASTKVQRQLGKTQLKLRTLK